jgi:hypothetical protein
MTFVERVADFAGQGPLQSFELCNSKRLRLRVDRRSLGQRSGSKRGTIPALSLVSYPVANAATTICATKPGHQCM